MKAVIFGISVRSGTVARAAPMTVSLNLVRSEAKLTLRLRRAASTQEVEAETAPAWERPAKCPVFGMRLTYLLAVTASILALAGAGAADRRKHAPVRPAARESCRRTK